MDRTDWDRKPATRPAKAQPKRLSVTGSDSSRSGASLLDSKVGNPLLRCPLMVAAT